MEQPEGTSVATQQSTTPQTLGSRALDGVQGAQLSKRERKQLLKAQQQTQVRAEFYAGLLPHPEHLERFEQLQPGTTNRLIAMAERQGEHRQVIERKFLNFNGFSQVAGTLFAGAVALMSVGGAIYLLATGHPLTEFAACLVPLAPIVWAFRKARTQQRSEIARKR